MHRVPNEKMKNSYQTGSNAAIQDLLWISRQQQHPLTNVHPLKNTIKMNLHGQRCKFNGKQWRPLCESKEDFECRNLAFRSSFCQKHFYKVHVVKRPPIKSNFIPQLSLKRSLLTKYEQQSKERNEIEGNDDSIEVIEDNQDMVNKPDLSDQSQSEYNCFAIDSSPQLTYRNEKEPKRSNSIHSSSSDSSSSLTNSMTKVLESIRLGNPPLTRTEEKSLANEFIYQFPLDISFQVAEQIARQRICEIMFDNYSQRLSPENISFEWFYDFLLRNPRLPIHFQTWFSSIPSTLPMTDQMIDIKIWELGLVARSVLSSPGSKFSPSSSSP